MTTTLADVTLLTARLVARTTKGTATANEAVTTQLTDIVNLIMPNDPISGGTVWFRSGANIGLVRPILTYVVANNRITFAAVTGNPAIGNTYELVDNLIATYEDLKQAVNLALQEIGGIPTLNESLAANGVQQVYTLPTGVSHVSGVEIVSNLGTTGETSYPSYHWRERGGKLLIDNGVNLQGDFIRLIYLVPAADLTTDASALDGSVDLKSIVYVAGKHALRMALMRFRKDKAEIPEWLNERIVASQHWIPNVGTDRVRVHSA